jgi:hypothetical protein
MLAGGRCVTACEADRRKRERDVTRSASPAVLVVAPLLRTRAAMSRPAAGRSAVLVLSRLSAVLHLSICISRSVCLLYCCCSLCHRVCLTHFIVCLSLVFALSIAISRIRQQPHAAWARDWLTVSVYSLYSRLSLSVILAGIAAHTALCLSSVSSCLSRPDTDCLPLSCVPASSLSGEIHDTFLQTLSLSSTRLESPQRKAHATIISPTRRDSTVLVSQLHRPPWSVSHDSRFTSRQSAEFEREAVDPICRRDGDHDTAVPASPNTALLVTIISFSSLLTAPPSS